MPHIPLLIVSDIVAIWRSDHGGDRRLQTMEPAEDGREQGATNMRRLITFGIVAAGRMRRITQESGDEKPFRDKTPAFSAYSRNSSRYISSFVIMLNIAQGSSAVTLKY